MNQAKLLILSVIGAGTVLIPSRWGISPPILILLLLVFSLAGLVAARWFQSRWVLPLVAFSLGAAMSVWQINSALSYRVPDQFIGQDVVVTLKVRSVVDERPVRQVIIADTVAAPKELLARRWRITWYGVPKHASPENIAPDNIENLGKPIELNVDDVWQMTVRVRSMSGTGNPGGFDVTGWYLRSHIDGVAYVRHEPAPVQLAHSDISSIHGWRASLAERVTNLSPKDDYDQLVVALVLGFRTGIDDAFKDLLVATGTAHLLAISGLHIGLVSAAAFVLFKMLWGFFPNSIGRRYSRYAFAGIFSVCVALGYAVLAGSSPSTLRAVGMCMVGFFVLWQRRSLSLWLPFSISLAFVVFTDVLRLLSPGVWLSFCTVALIMVLYRPNTTNDAVSRSVVNAWRTHAALGVCLLPLTGWFFSQGSLVAPVANVLAVPIVSFAVVPLSLLVVLFVDLAPPLAALFLSMANGVIGALERWLEFCAAFPFSDTSITVPSIFTLMLSVMGVLCLCAPKAVGLRRFSLPLCVPILVWSVGARQVNGLELHVLDVGQGHASLVFTENHVVLVDTGGTIGGARTHWKATVLPALHKLGRTDITHIIISHSDSDHAAGADELAEEFPDAEFWLGGVGTVAGRSDAKRCTAGDHWQLDGVEFSFLHPAAQAVDPVLIGQKVSDNDLSCVLLVQIGKSTALFPGDIERGGEALMMQRLLPSASAQNEPIKLPEAALGGALALQERVTVLVAPHHGSRTSSTAGFVQGWQPEHIVYPAGHRNRLGFPHDDVRMRYKEMGSVSYVTGQDGAVRFIMGPSGLLAEPTRYWDHNLRLWHTRER